VSKYLSIIHLTNKRDKFKAKPGPPNAICIQVITDWIYKLNTMQAIGFREMLILIIM